MSDNRTRVWFSLFVLAIFCVGLALGMVLGRRMPPPPGRAGTFAGPASRGGPGGRGAREGMLIERLDRELQLTDDQRSRVQAIFDERRSHLEGVRREIATRAEQEQRELQAEVRKVLTPDQQARFDRWLAEQPRGRRLR
jgi:Spy/CpxP family protein refolding chaperone